MDVGWTSPPTDDRRVTVRQLDPAIVRVWSLLGALASGPLLVAGLIATAVTGGHPIGWAVLAAGIIAVVIVAGVAPRLRYRYFRWGVDDGVLRIHDGVLWRSEAAVPVFRIQHIDLEQGPLDRWAGLQQLTVHTAAPAADAELPGIRADEAAVLRTHLLELSRASVVASSVRQPGISDAV